MENESTISELVNGIITNQCDPQSTTIKDKIINNLSSFYLEIERRTRFELDKLKSKKDSFSLHVVFIIPLNIVLNSILG